MTNPMTIFIISVALLCAYHLACNAYGVPAGTQLRWLFYPFVLAIYAVTLGRVDLRRCAGCKRREQFVNRVLGGTQPHWKESK